MLRRIALAVGLFAALIPLPGLLGAVACSARREAAARPSSTREYKTLPFGPLLLAMLDVLFVGWACRALLRSVGP